MRILVLDNYDSFTYNLVHIIRELGFGPQMDIFRNDKLGWDEVARYDKILLSPGPGIPNEAGIMQEVIRRYGSEKSILGVCLGHQGIAEVYGAQLFNMPVVLHGIANEVQVLKEDDYIFSGIPLKFKACRYHSWSVLGHTVKDSLEIIAQDEKGEVMAIRHKTYDVRGVQFHPESILTEYGKEMMQNWLTKPYTS